MKLVHLRAVIFMAFGLVLILGLTRIGDPPVLLVEPTPAALTPCVKAPQPCGAACARLIEKRSLS